MIMGLIVGGIVVGYETSFSCVLLSGEDGIRVLWVVNEAFRRDRKLGLILCHIRAVAWQLSWGPNQTSCGHVTNKKR